MRRLQSQPKKKEKMQYLWKRDKPASSPLRICNQSQMNKLQFLAQSVVEGLHYPWNLWNLPVSLGLVPLLGCAALLLSDCFG